MIDVQIKYSLHDTYEKYTPVKLFIVSEGSENCLQRNPLFS